VAKKMFWKGKVEKVSFLRKRQSYTNKSERIVELYVFLQDPVSPTTTKVQINDSMRRPSITLRYLGC